jgi:hypothetical protein
MQSTIDRLALLILRGLSVPSLMNVTTMHVPLRRRATGPVRQGGQQHSVSTTSAVHTTAASATSTAAAAAATHASGSTGTVVLQSQQSQSQQRMHELQRLPVSHRPVRWAAMQSAAARRSEARERCAMQHEETAQRHINKYTEVRGAYTVHCILRVLSIASSIEHVEL